MTGSEVPTVLIVDDDTRMRAALQRLLKTVDLRSECFSSPEEFFQSRRPSGPSCLVLDLRLPGMSGLEVQKKLIEMEVQIPIVFITGYADIPVTVKAMKSGAVDFLTKPFRDQDLLDAIQQALKLDGETTRQVKELTDLKERYATLTAREREVMLLIVSGMLTKQIAVRIGTTEITAAVHRGQVMRKMQATSPAELGRLAERLKLPMSA